MRTLSILWLSAALAGCATIGTADGFDEVASQGEVVSIDGVGWGRTGNFTIVPLNVSGSFSRAAASSTTNGEKLARGRLAFRLAGSGEFAGLEAECAHSRETFEISEPISERTTWRTSLLTGPYVMTCGFFRGTEAIGGLAVQERQGGTLDVRELRSGRAEVGSAEMRLVSVHTTPSLGMPTSAPLGYGMDFRTGERAMLFVNGADRQVALPRAGRDARAAALLAGIALALVWDPGDGD